ncbi:unnamed protein product [Blepharisma stoltei]|uniref:Phospholipid-transporting ATPase n=1 Tax=Blepharisma stoltei TaxID=1481888 RepID=A0AAU9JYB1_9CILI|nr:unnamed protein product [Blepharisma stoltei]
MSSKKQGVELIQAGSQSNSEWKEGEYRRVEFGFGAHNDALGNNRIKTSKYTIINWAPKSLLWQFRRVANIYFLVISILTCMPFSPKSPVSLIATFGGVLVFTMFKEAYEDYFRHKSDNAVNSAVNYKLDLATKTVIEIPCMDIKVGDILQIKENQGIPADIVLLSTSNPKGIAMVNTMNLDGETNLKEKTTLETTRGLQTPEQLANFRGILRCDLPHMSLIKWNCNFEGPDKTMEPMGMNQLLLRGCVLKNTKHVFGVVVYTGIETKIVLNSKAAPSKMSNVLRTMNTMLYAIFAFQLTVCLVFSGFSMIWRSENGSNHVYLATSDEVTPWIFIAQALTFLVAYSHLIPISLYVALEVLKMLLSYLISQDRELYYMPDDRPTTCRTSDLVEELGQVEFVFSDKTGTLTCNVMEFKKCSIGGSIYGYGNRSKAWGVGEDTKPDAILQDPHHPNHDEVKMFFTLLAVCHSVLPSPDPENPKKPKYQAASPDELALVEGSCDMGIVFSDRIDGKEIINYRGEQQTWEVIAEVPFNSDRKRMSVVVREPHTGKYMLMTKGADMVMMKLLKKNQSFETLDKHMHTFAIEGLRTLVLAYRYIDDHEFDEWIKIWKEIQLSKSPDKSERLDAHGGLLENNLNLLGATAIEDKLQDGVPEAVSFLLSSGIRVWVLTGDKQETAIEIGKACNLVQPSMTLVDLSSTSLAEFSAVLDYYVNLYSLKTMSIKDLLKFKETMTERLALVIDGLTLVWALDAKQAYRENFFKLGLISESCICCRVSPAQKAQVVALAKESGPWITLAIGDGANDVSMIQEAHIGVGIAGKEGSQAVQASDYAFCQFKYLQKLLLVHGRWGYRRISYFICYYFYKNVTVVFAELCFSFLNGFSGQVYFLDWLPMLFNALWTSWPCLLIFLFEQDLNAEDSFKYPVAYQAGPRKAYFSFKVFWRWVVFAIWHGVLCFFIPNMTLYKAIDEVGQVAGLWFVSTITFTLVIHVITFKLFLESVFWNKISIVAGMICIGFYYLCLIGLNTSVVAKLAQPDLNQLFYLAFSLPKTWLVVFFTPFLALIPDFIFKTWDHIFHPTPIDLIIKRITNKS